MFKVYPYIGGSHIFSHVMIIVSEKYTFCFDRKFIKKAGKTISGEQFIYITNTK